MRFRVIAAALLLCVLPSACTTTSRCCRHDAGSSSAPSARVVAMQEARHVVAADPDDGDGPKYAAIRNEARAKLFPIVSEARRLFGEYTQRADAQFAEFRGADPERFVLRGEAIAHVEPWRIDVFEPETHVFAWVWKDGLGVIAFSDAHVESTTDRDLYDSVVKAGRGRLKPQQRTYMEGGEQKTESLPAGPAERR